MGILGEGLDALLRARKASQAEIDKIAKGLVIGGETAAKTGAKVASKASPTLRGLKAGDTLSLDGLTLPKAVSIGDNGGPPLVSLKDAYEARAAQMELAPGARIQPDPNRTRMVDQDYRVPAPGTRPDMSQQYPRNPDPTAALPLGGRAQILVDRKSDIARQLAAKIVASGQMGADTRYFYHSDGPLYRSAIASGLSEDDASRWLDDFAQNFAATSPRTKVEENLRNATSAMAKQAAGIPHRQIVGPGTATNGVPGLSERGYPMMTGGGGIHGQLLDDVHGGSGIDMNTNTKPANFGANMAGNRSGVTVDTHAIRGTLQTLNELSPGSVPDGFIMPQHREAYWSDPTTLTPDMIADTVGSQMIGPKGARYKAQTEYPVFADIFHEAADILGVSPAEAQSMAWFGLGGDTNLGSMPKTVADSFDERLNVTAKALNISPEMARQMVFQRKIPLLAAGGATLGGGLLSSAPNDGPQY